MEEEEDGAVVEVSLVVESQEGVGRRYILSKVLSHAASDSDGGSVCVLTRSL